MFILKSTHNKIIADLKRIIADLKRKPSLTLYKFDYPEYTLQIVGDSLEWDSKEIEIFLDNDVIFWTKNFPNFWTATSLPDDTQLKPGVQ